MTTENFNTIFTGDVLEKLFPKDRADQFFDALFGDASDGAYDISLEFKGYNQNELEFQFRLDQRPGKCLACHLTRGLPKVFSRHPVIDIKGLVQDIGQLLNGRARHAEWQIGGTLEVSGQVHVIPLFVSLDASET